MVSALAVRDEYVSVKIETNDLEQSRQRLERLGIRSVSVPGSTIRGRLPIAATSKLEWVPGIVKALRASDDVRLTARPRQSANAL